MSGWKLIAEREPIAAAIVVCIAAVRLIVHLLVRFGVVKPERENRVFGDALAFGAIAVIVLLIIADEYWIWEKMVMKKELKNWQAVLLTIAFVAACFAVIFGVGWLLSKASWIVELEWMKDAAAMLWIVLYGVHLLLSSKLLSKFPACKKIDLIFQEAAFVCLTVRVTVGTAFKFAGI